MNVDCIRGGHNFQCPGASATNVGGLDETIEDRKVYASAIKYAKAGGDIVIDGTPGNCSENEDLNYGTNKANASGANTFVPIHFNKAYDKYVGRIGSEIWLNPQSASSVVKGTRILNNLAALGFKNRGLKDGMNGEHLHDIRASKMDAVLVEVCFCEATEDIALYRKLGPDIIGKAIAEGILGHTISGNSTNIILTSAPVVGTQMYRIRKSWADGGSQLGAYTSLTQAVKDLCDKNPGYEVYNNIGTQVYPSTIASVANIVPATRVNNSIAQLQAELNKQGFGHLKVDGFFGPLTLKACPLVKIGATGEITKWIQKRLTLKLQDGKFGSGTKAAVTNFQIAMHFSASGCDGVVGENTWTAFLK